MQKTHAFTPFYDERILFHTARSAREAEFDYLMLNIAQHVGFQDGLKENLKALAGNLRSGVYPSSVDAFLKAAEYLKEYRYVLAGAANDPANYTDR